MQINGLYANLEVGIITNPNKYTSVSIHVHKSEAQCKKKTQELSSKILHQHNAENKVHKIYT